MSDSDKTMTEALAVIDWLLDLIEDGRIADLASDDEYVQRAEQAQRQLEGALGKATRL